ncbi:MULTISPECIES: hypothetical protein [unclassified Anabaena]|uniref:hypothetical protein n=1 Tax=unclassified Anabaena TaxID=2619674 RepID=UPI000831319F|nr:MULTISPECIES: hypothetical protein [unclassified Anabaena]
MKNSNRCWQNFTLATLVASLSLSCDFNVARQAEQVNAVEQQKTETKISYGDLIIKQQSDYLMIPVNVKEQNSDKDSFLDKTRDYKRGDGSLYNLIFYHKQDGKTHLLLDKKAVINAFELIETKPPGKTPTRVFLYKIIDQDTNKDKKLNQQDAVIGYISDLSGKNLKQVTPNNTKMINWVVLPSQNAIFIKIIKDSNNDNKFTTADKTNFVRVNLEQPSQGIEIISDQIEQKINSLF